MRISDFKNGKILSEFHPWMYEFYDLNDLLLQLSEFTRVNLSEEKKEELVKILNTRLTHEEEELILAILNRLGEGKSQQKTFSEIPIHTTLRLCGDRPRSEWCVDKLGFYCYESGRYEVPFVGVMLKKIVEEILFLVDNHREMLTNKIFLEFLVPSISQAPNPKLPKIVADNTLVTVRKWFVAQVLIHEMAHAYLDRKGKRHDTWLEEAMANMITLSVADFFGDDEFLEFVIWLISRQQDNYRFAIDLYDSAKKHHLSPADILLCGDIWADQQTKTDICYDSFGAEKVYDSDNADLIINTLVKISRSFKTQEKELIEDSETIEIWLRLIEVCRQNDYHLESFDYNKPLSGKVIWYDENVEDEYRIRLKTIAVR